MCIILDGKDEVEPQFDFSEFLLMNAFKNNVIPGLSATAPAGSSKQITFTPISDDEDDYETQPTTSITTTKISKYSDKRRHASKLAARTRRSKESEIFQDLGESLPISGANLKNLDKTSVLRLVVCDLKIRKSLGIFGSAIKMNPMKLASSGLLSQYESNIGNTLGGFIIIMSANGDINYVSEDISNWLGLAQCDVMGKSIYDYSHPCDHGDVKELLSIKKGQSKVTPRSGLIRMKNTLTSRGGNVNLRAATNKVIHFTGKLYLNDLDESTNCFIGVGETIPHPSDFDFSKYNSQTFTTTHAPDMKILSADQSIGKFLGYKSNHLIGKSLFDFQHAEDWQSLSSLFKALYSKGQIETSKYRFLANNGGWAWVITQATAIYSSNNNRDPTNIICRHYIISEVQTTEILSYVQINAADDDVKENTDDLMAQFENVVADLNKNKASGSMIVGGELPTPIPNTTKVFAPRTQDMNTGFLLPSGKESYQEKHEELDLTHLAPVAGNDCIPIKLGLFEDLLKPLSGDADTDGFDGFDDQIIDIDELSLLNSLENDVSFIPFDVDKIFEKDLLDIDSAESSSGSSSNGSEQFDYASTAPATASAYPEKIQKHINNSFESKQQKEDMEMNLLSNLSSELDDFCSEALNTLLSAGESSYSSSNSTTSSDDSGDIFHEAMNQNRKWSMPHLETNIPPDRSAGVFDFDIESILGKRKSDGDLPNFATGSVFKTNTTGNHPSPSKYSKLTELLLTPNHGNGKLMSSIGKMPTKRHFKSISNR